MATSSSSSSCIHCKGGVSTKRCQISSCGHCTESLACPPPVKFLLANFPDLKPDYGLDRNQRRCQHCDLINTHKKVIDAENPPPHYVNSVKIIRSHVKTASRTFDNALDRKSDLAGSLPGLQEALTTAVRLRDQKAEKAWMEYWGVWGRGKVEQESREASMGVKTYYPRFVHFYPDQIPPP